MQLLVVRPQEDIDILVAAVEDKIVKVEELYIYIYREQCTKK